MDTGTGLAGLFISAFTSATVLPGTSEAVLAAEAAAKLAPIITLVAVASVGNILGSCVNWWLGRQVNRFSGRKWFPASGAQMERAERWYRKWGRWSLLASWVPIVGDPLTVVAGALRERFLPFVAIVTLAKTGRYAAVGAGLSVLM